MAELSRITSARILVFENIVAALTEKFGDQVQPDLDALNESYLIYIGKTTLELTFNEDAEN